MHSGRNIKIKILTDILHYTGTNPAEREKIEIEQEAWRTENAMLADKEKELLKKLTESERALSAKDKVLVEKDRLIEELINKLKEK